MAFQTRYGHFKSYHFAYSMHQQAFRNKLRKNLAKQLSTFIIMYLDDIFNSIKTLGQVYKKLFRLKTLLKKNNIFCHWTRFVLNNIILVSKTRLKDKKTKIVKSWLKSKLNSSKIVRLLIFMLKIANNSSKILLILVYIIEKNKIIDEILSDRTINLFKPNIINELSFVGFI